MSTSAHHLALRYLLELSTDIRGALLIDRGGAVLASAGHLATDDVAGAGRRIAAAAHLACANSETANGERPLPSVEIDVFSGDGAMFLLAEADLVMTCITNRTVHPGLIFYDMHAVLRDLDRAAAAEAVREEGAPA